MYGGPSRMQDPYSGPAILPASRPASQPVPNEYFGAPKNGQNLTNRSQIVVKNITPDANSNSNSNNINNNNPNKVVKPVEKAPSLPTFSECQRLTYVFIILAYSVTAVILSSLVLKNYPEYTSNRLELNEVMTNWNLEAIDDIIVQNLDPQDITNKYFIRCPDGYESFSSFQGQRILDGCNCLGTTSTTRPAIMTIGLCTTAQVADSCASVTGIQPSGYNWFVSGTDVFDLCIKRLKGVTYLSNGKENSNCPKSCGGSTTRTKFCVSSTVVQCPINYIMIAASAPVVGSVAMTVLPIGGTNNLYFSRTGPDLPIVEFAVTKGLGVCLDNKIQNLLSTATIHPLLDQSTTKVCSAIDVRYQSIFQMTEAQQITKNYWTTAYTAIPTYLLGSADKVELYVRPMIGLSGSRRGSDIQTITDSYFNYTRIHDSSIALLITSCVYAIVVFLFNGSLSLINIIDKKYKLQQYLLEISKKNLIQTKKTRIFSRISGKIVMTIFQLTCVIITFTYTIGYNNYMKNLTGGNTVLGDTYMVALANHLNDEFTYNILWYIVSHFIIFLVIIIIETIVLFKLCAIPSSAPVTKEVKYQQPKQNTATDNHVPISPNVQQQRLLEMQEFQSNNMYAGQGLNTSMTPLHPPMQQNLDTSQNYRGQNNRSINNNQQNGNGFPVRQSSQIINRQVLQDADSIIVHPQNNQPLMGNRTISQIYNDGQHERNGDDIRSQKVPKINDIGKAKQGTSQPLSQRSTNQQIRQQQYDQTRMQNDGFNDNFNYDDPSLDLEFNPNDIGVNHQPRGIVGSQMQRRPNGQRTQLEEQVADLRSASPSRNQQINQYIPNGQIIQPIPMSQQQQFESRNQQNHSSPNTKRGQVSRKQFDKHNQEVDDINDYDEEFNRDVYLPTYQQQFN